MRVVISRTGRYVAKLSLQIVPSVAASVLGGYLLAQLVPQHAAAPDDQPKPVALKVDGAPVVNDRAPIRVVPLPQHDGQAEPPAEVKRVETKRVDTKPAEAKPVVAKSAEAKPAEAKPIEARSTEAKQAEGKPIEVKKVASVPAVAPAQAAPQDVKPAHAKSEAVAAVQPYTPEPYTPDADPPQVAAQPVLQAAPQVYSSPAAKGAPPAAVPSVVASTAPALPAPTTVGPAVGAPIVLSPVAVGAPRQINSSQPQSEAVAVAEPPRRNAERGAAGQVFSTISSAAGTAANATGDTINWVIGLPGRLIGHDDDPHDDPQQAPQPRRLM